jgi:hypothetical protein
MDPGRRHGYRPDECDRIASISLFQACNTIHMGVDGMSTQAYSQLSDQEVWDLTF